MDKKAKRESHNSTGLDVTLLEKWFKTMNPLKSDCHRYFGAKQKPLQK